jgi:sugar phosphate isomerase/epimerase
MGYEGVEFYGNPTMANSAYFYWTPAYTKEVRKLLDDLGLACFSTHSESPAFTPDGLTRAIELNKILGSQSIVAVRGLAPTSGKLAFRGFEGTGLDGYKRLADRLGQAAERLRAVNMTCAFHTHAVEFQKIDGVRPIDIIAGANEVVLHTDIDTVAMSGTDPVAFIEQYPGRHHCVLCSEWPRNAQNHQPIFGKGGQPWKKIFAAAEGTGGVRFYLMQRETSDEPPIDAVRKDLENFRQLHG